MTIASAIPAAVVSMAVLRLLGGGADPREQHRANRRPRPAPRSPPGVIFTMPALVILGLLARLRFLVGRRDRGLGGILGVLFSVPLRRSLIVEQPLAVPRRQGGGRSAQGRREPGAGREDLGRLGARRRSRQARRGERPRLWSRTRRRARRYVGKAIAYFGTNLSPALLGVGYIVGLNVGIVVLSGGVIVVERCDPDLRRVRSTAIRISRRSRGAHGRTTPRP